MDLDHPFLAHPGVHAFAHRGGTEAAPENSLAAFAAAVALGMPYLETDVHRTADGVMVAFHDDQLDRVTDMDGRIVELPWSEVSQARIGGTEPIPTMDQVLESFPTTRINVDAKSHEVVVTLAECLRRHAALDRVCVGGFSDRRLDRLRSLLGDGLCTSAGPRETAAFMAGVKLPGFRVPAEAAYRCLQLPVRQAGIELVTPATVAAAHANGLAVHVWTIDDPREMHRLLDLGVDGIMTDRPSVLRRVLEDRGQWV
ncbi:MAG: glycerophosphodiester phosphodiesterase [Actinomycetes bacterium]